MHEIKAPGFEPSDAYAPDSKDLPLSLLRNLHTFLNPCAISIYDFYKKRNTKSLESSKIKLAERETVTKKMPARLRRHFQFLWLFDQPM